MHIVVVSNLLPSLQKVFVLGKNTCILIQVFKLSFIVAVQFFALK